MQSNSHFKKNKSLFLSKTECHDLEIWIQLPQILYFNVKASSRSIYRYIGKESYGHFSKTLAKISGRLVTAMWENLCYESQILSVDSRGFGLVEVWVY